MKKRFYFKRVLIFIIVILLGINCYILIKTGLVFLNKKPAIKKEKNKLNSLPALYTEANKIKSSNNGKAFILKGVSTQLFGYHDYDINIFWERFYLLDKLGINLIVAFINYNTPLKKIKQLDELVKKTEKYNIYLCITPTLDSRESIHHVKKFPQIQEFIAKRYQKKKHILYGVWAEPRNITPNEYLVLIKDTVNMVRRYQPSAIIVISGMSWGANFYDLDLNYLKNLKNIILNFHYYPAKNSKELSYFLKLNEDYPWERFMNKFPVLIGEFGGVWQEDFSSDEDLFFIKKTVDNINQNYLNYVFYSVDLEEGLSLFEGLTNQLSKKGEILKNDLINFPPGSFTN